jgi:DNA-directed RNA polymerase subunit N (RpoN/RPB10)
MSGAREFLSGDDWMEAEMMTLPTEGIQRSDFEDRLFQELDSRAASQREEFYGEYEQLPPVRCYNCGKVIGAYFQRYKQMQQQRKYEPAQIIKRIVFDSVLRRELLNLLETDYAGFVIRLEELGLKADYDLFESIPRYESDEVIFNKLGFRRPCCRLNLFNPPHVPTTRREDFYQPLKETTISNPLEAASAATALPATIRLTGTDKRPTTSISTPSLPIVGRGSEETIETTRRPKIIKVSSIRPSLKKKTDEEILQALRTQEIDEIRPVESSSEVSEIDVGRGYTTRKIILGRRAI